MAYCSNQLIFKYLTTENLPDLMLVNNCLNMEEILLNMLMNLKLL